MSKIEHLLFVVKVLNIMIVVINILRRLFIKKCMLIEFPEKRSFMTVAKVFKLIFMSFIIYLGPQYEWIGENNMISQKNLIFGANIYYHYNDVLQIVSLLKIYIIFRSWLRTTDFSNKRSSRVW